MSDNPKQRLTELRTKLDRLPDTRAPPPPTLDILGRSQQEQDWQRLLFHFLSPTESHGLDDKLLGHFLSALADRPDLEFGFSYFDLHNVRVETEVSTSNNGRVDAVMWVPETWFICWELKVYASEGGEQTVYYVEADSFPTIDVEKRDSPITGNYVYLAPDAASPPEASEFIPVSWEWVVSELQAFLDDGHGRYPARTTAQIEDFIGTIRSELTMTDHEENEREKAELYLDYYDEIAEVQRSFENRWTELSNNWATWLAGNLDAKTVGDLEDVADDDVVVEIELASGERERWIFQQGQSDWAGIMKYGWRRDKEDPSKVYISGSDREDIRLRFYHRLELNRELAIEDHTLELQLYHGTDTPDRFMKSFKDKLRTKIGALDTPLPSSFTVTGSKAKPLTATYDIPVSEYEDFFDAYVGALTNAVHHLTREKRALTAIIDEAFEESLDTLEENPD